MYNLTRLSLKNWYLCTAEDIEFRGSIGILGGTGAGKSSLLDAIQTVVSGLNHNRIHLNASAETRSERKVIDYCLGYLDPKKDGGVPLRQACESIIALTFSEEQEDGSLHHVSAGVVMTAREGDGREQVVTRFIAPGISMSAADWKAVDDEGAYLKDWEEIEIDLKRQCPQLLQYRSAAERFVEDMLAVMRRGAAQPNARRFMNAFFNALQFKPINDPTAFVRNFILESDPLNINRVREQVDRWREFTAAARIIATKLETLKSITASYDRWGRLVLEKLELRMRVACAKIRIARYELGDRAEALRQIGAELDAARMALALIAGNIEKLESEYQAKRDILNARGVTSRLSEIKAKRELLVRDMRDAERVVPSLKQMLQAVTNLEAARCIPGSYSPAIASAKYAIGILQAKPGLAWMRSDRDSILGHLDTIRMLETLPERLKPQIEGIEGDLHVLRGRRAILDENVRRAGDGASPLAGYTHDFIKLLAENGIKGVPLCDIVEVMDENWQFAVESVLGLRREAIIVTPAECRRAHDILYRNRNRGLRNCRLVKTTDTATSDARVKGGSIFEVLSTDDHHAEAYLKFHLGGVLKAENENELERMRTAIMQNGKATGGMDYQVHPDKDFRTILGKAAQSAAAEADRRELDEVQEAIVENERNLRILKQVDDIARGAAAYEIDLDAVAAMLESIENSQKTLEDQEAAVRAEFDDGLSEEVDRLDGEIRRLKANHAICNREIEGLNDKRVRADVAFHAAVKQTKSALAEKRGVDAAFEETEVQVLREYVRYPDGEKYFGWLDPFVGKRLELAETPRAEAIAFYRDSESEARVRLASAPMSDRGISNSALNSRTRLMDGYCRTYNIEFPYGDLENTPYHRDYVWAIHQRNRLETNELREHLERVQNAEKEMVSAIKEDLLSRLSDKFNRLENQIRSLNDYLKKQDFTGGQIYKFGKRVDPTLGRIRRLALAVAENPDNANTIIEKRHHDPELNQAMVELENYIEDSGGQGLEDYRNYFSFDMYMVPKEHADDDLDIVQTKMSLSGRSGVASGGEGQAPLYVAMAASMAMAYFPGGHPSRGPSGMGLVMFDEAFDKLDISNTQALIKFFSDFNLQLLVAAPESERSTFTEVFDTIVTVSKDKPRKLVYIASDFPKERARRELAAINPNRKGVEGFRAEIDAAEAAE